MPEKDEAGSRFEEEGIPDLQDGTPQQQWVEDPQEAPIPGDVPLGADEWGTTIAEQVEGEPLGLRLSREEPEVWDEPGRQREQDDPDASLRAQHTDAPGNLYRPTTEHAGRIVEPDEGTAMDTEPTAVARDVGADGGGYTAEERAMHIEEAPG